MALIDHLEKLKYFYRVSESKSIQACAHSLGISQAGLSKSIKTLEESLGKSLLVRSSGGVSLTFEGEVLKKACREIFDITSRVETQLLSRSVRAKGEVFRVGMYESFAIYFYSELHQFLTQVAPLASISSQLNKSSVLQEQLDNGDLDFAFGAGFQKSSGAFAVHQLFEDTYSFYSSPKSELSVSEMPLIYYPEAKDSKEQNLHNLLSKINKKNIRSIQTMNFESAKALAVQGHGIAVVPQLVARTAIRSSQLRQTTLEGFPLIFGRHSISIIVRNKFQGEHTALVSGLIQAAQNWYKQS